MTVAEIVKKHLDDNGLDGLYSEYCGCEKYDLCPCGNENCLECKPGYKHECDKCNHARDKKADCEVEGGGEPGGWCIGGSKKI